MGLQWIRPKFIASVVSVWVLISGESQGSFLMKDLVDGFSRLCLKKKPEPKKIHPFSQHKALVSRQGKTKLSLIHKQVQRRSLMGHQKNVQDNDQQSTQVFGNPLYDKTFKTVLRDDLVRLEFIRTFAKLPNVESTELLDTHLNPLKQFGVLKKTLKNPSFRQMIKRIQEKKEVTLDDCRSPILKDALMSLGGVLDDLIELIPEKRDSQVDVLCRLSTKDYALVEVQVPKDDMWDARALAYAAHIYGNQLRSGQKWNKLKSVIGINILGTESNNHWPEEEGFIRHYKMKDDATPPHVIPQLQLIQYSLGNIKGEEAVLTQDQNLKRWLDYWRRAENQREVPQDASTGLKKAYELIKFTGAFTSSDPRYRTHKTFFNRYKEHMTLMKMDGFKKGREEGKEEGKTESAMNLLAMGVEVEKIAKATGLSEEKILSLKTQQST